MYEQIVAALIKEIHKFKDYDDTFDCYIVKEITKKERPPLPFFSYAIYDTYQRITFKDVNHEPFVMSLQIKSHADSDTGAADMALALNKLFNSLQFQEDLADIGIGVNPDIHSLPPDTEDFQTRYEFTSGIDVNLLINDNYRDTTQSQGNTIDSFGLSVNNKTDK